MKKTGLFLIITSAIFMVNCSQPGSDEIEKKIISIRNQDISDKRLEYFEVSVTGTGTERQLSGATVSASAYEQLNALAKKEQLDFRVELLPSPEFRENPWGIVALSVCNLRANNRHSAEMVTQALLGTPVKIYAKDDDWYLVQTPDRYFGWVDASGIVPKSQTEMQAWKNLPKVLFAANSGIVYESASEQAAVVADLAFNDLLSVSDSTGAFYQVILPDGQTGFVNKTECLSLDIWKKKSIDAGLLMATAKRFKGVPYLWGGTSSKMLDCSGFTKTSYLFQGLVLQRDASQQTLYGQEVDVDKGYGVLQPGDLVFFGRKADAAKPERVTHVGLCMGNSEFIHASGKVRINSLDSSSPIYTNGYEKNFVRARRVIGEAPGNGLEWAVDNEFYQQILP